MLPLLRSKCHGCRIASTITHSLCNITHDWKVTPAPAPLLFAAQLERGKTRVLIYANPKCPCQRVCDQVRVLVDGADVYIPLLSRIQLRAAARYRVQLFAETEL